MGNGAVRAVIVGGGTAGLAAAIALRNVGLDVLILERAQALDDVRIGGGHVLWHNAVLALRRLGVGRTIEAEAPVLERYDFRTSSGRRLATWQVGERGREMDVPAVTIGRPALHRILAEAAGDVLRVGAAVVGFDQDDRGVTVRLADGSDERATIVIGADGLRSLVRTRLFGEQQPTFAGYTAWQGVTRFADRALADGVFTNTSGRGIRFFSFRMDRGDTVYWNGVTGVHAGRKDLTSSTKQGTLLERFGTWHEPIPSMIEATPETSIRTIDIYDRDPINTWGEGRVTLIGDAAHPSTFNLGQGACQALEDAVALGRALQARSDPTMALRTYESGRMKRTAAMTMTARRIGKIEQLRNPLVCRLRDAFVAVAHERFVVKQVYSLMMNHQL